eukprot:TRINITY_DN4550_c0_g2_i1.p1 TRINITY_DN4550_c0_g2~~TRINITY_DN4550_c0_g2_i1.p1  ORF type:complete len:106 (-),score=28.61 TRINITY_DN4550_c0_g2_i1:254-571(-)
MESFTEEEIDKKLKDFIGLLQDSNTTSNKHTEIDKFCQLMISQRKFILKPMQVDFLYEGNEDAKVLGLCQFAGRRKGLEKTVKRSCISALAMIYELVTKSGTPLL